MAAIPHYVALPIVSTEDGELTPGEPVGPSTSGRHGAGHQVLPSFIPEPSPSRGPETPVRGGFSPP